MLYFIKHLIFLFNTFYILSSESLLYCVFRDYSSFIDRITSKLAKVNILYVKIFQAVALNNRFIDEKMNNRLLKFTDNAPWSINDIDFDALYKMSRKFNLYSPDCFIKPINSGMISLVFKAIKVDTGEEVAIKVKRCRIDITLEDAIDDLLFLVGFLNFIPIFYNFQISSVIQRNIDMIQHQTNFLEEIDNMMLFNNNCKNLKYVKIPNVYEEITHTFNNIIVMEFVNGITIDKINKEDYEGFAKQIIKFGFVTSLVHGVTHGDLHGGNILFIKDNTPDAKYKHKICVLDFGIIYKINNNSKGLFFEIITELFHTPPNMLAEKLLYSGLIEPVDTIKSMSKTHLNNILEIITDIIKDTMYKSKSVNQIQIYYFISKFKQYIDNNNISKYGLRISDQFVKLQLMFAMAQGVTLTLCDDNYIDIADKVINELFHTNLLEIE